METGKRKERVGTVVSDKMSKTAVIEVASFYKHSLYKKTLKKFKKYKVDDPENKCNIGDKVRIIETRPLSKTKRWRLLEILRKAE